MADYVNLGPVIAAVKSVGNQVQAVGMEVLDVKSNVYMLQNELEALKREFIRMEEENRRHAALQRAITEIIRVRQELERDFGNYKQVRNTMVGILEATDLQLVHETTIASCTEELMLATPRYWLAPVLIALSSWIADNRPLAERALREALRRDEEKTCLTFALICRRNKRTDACFQWLSRYFAMQKADDMKESIIAYIDAYTNGVFGVDRDNLCEEYIQNWMDELQQANPNFKEKQVNHWKNLYQTYCRDTSRQYAKLAECAKPDFDKMNAYLMRVNVAPEIIAFFSEIMGTEVDRATLVDAIDKELIKLVKNYDTDEAPLREEEEYLTDIKRFNGDEKLATQRREIRKARRFDRKVDLAERLSEAIVSNKKEDISAKKTAMRFMQDYIKDAFREFVEEKAADYPEEITIDTHGWKGKTKDGSNQAELTASYQNVIQERRNAQLATVKNTSMIVFFVLSALGLVAGAGSLVLGIVLTLVGGAAGGSDVFAALAGMSTLIMFAGIVFFLLGVVFLIVALVTKSKNKRRRLEINTRFDSILHDGLLDINLSIKQLIAINEIVRSFDAVECCNQLLSLTEGNGNG